MATRSFTQDNLNDDAARITWTGLLNGDDGAPATGMSEFDDRSVQVQSTFGAGGTVLIEGTVDGSNYQTLNDAFGVALSVTSARIRAVTEYVYAVRPRVTAGDGTTSLTVTMICKRKRK